MFSLIAADLRRHALGVLAVVVLVALATALGVTITLQERALRLGSARAAAAFDLVIGAPGSETQLVLSTVFLQPAPLPLLPGDVLAKLTADPRVRWAAPVGFGDVAEGLPIVGTTHALVDGLGGIADGRAFETMDQAVVGSDVRFALGAQIVPVHAGAHASTAWPANAHAGIRYTVVGRMAPTGTPWDRAILVPIEAVWRIHGRGEPAASGEFDKPGEADAHSGVNRGFPVFPPGFSASDSAGMPGLIVKPKSIADAYRLRQQWRSERTMAVFPGEVLTRLYGTLGDARRVLQAIAIGAQGLVLAAILLVVLLHVMQRRREIGALRALGARREAVLAVIWLQSFIILTAGVVLGFAIGALAARLLAGQMTAASGVAFPIILTFHDLGSLAGLVLAGGLIALVPAVLAYRQSPAAALRS